MENIILLLIPAMLAVLLVRMLLLPLRWFARLAVHSGCGLLCLWLLNLASGVTGVLFPVNAVTILVSGVLGLPGIGLLALLAVR